MKKNATITILACSISAFSGLANSAPVTYSEALYGELNGKTTLTLGSGQNTVSGTITQSDFDPFSFVVPQNTTVNSISYSFSKGTVVNYSPTVTASVGLGLSTGSELPFSPPNKTYVNFTNDTSPKTLFPLSTPLGSGTYAIGDYVHNNFMGGFVDYTYTLSVQALAPPPPPPPPPVRTPKVFGLAVGQDDGVYMKNGIAANDVYAALKEKSGTSWASESIGNTNGAMIYGGNPADDSIYAGFIKDAFFKRLDAMQVSDMDTLVLYVGAHGGQLAPYSENDELPDLNGNSQDELFSFLLTDDELTSYFNNDRWDGVRKIFLFDACSSGGFWSGVNNPNDVGDLNYLKNTAFFASAQEYENTYISPWTGRGVWTEALLLPALDDLASLTVGDLNQHISVAATSALDRYYGQELPLSGLNAPGSKAIFSPPRTFFAASGDFDVDAAIFPASVPEPGTAYVIFAGLVAMGIARRRYHS